ncbi:RNA polymerase II transcription mediator complex subunit 9-domain-containing protein [Apiospora kogelbergensis]|uniref:Mediator of RNA polymerase II transcription subunit 9 n=1 Tax=Apiospora kogelbergensis TaxID=1337665 RepID=A0AAW0R2Z9_9PEZI
MATPKNPPAGPPTPLGLPPGLSPDNLDTLTELSSLLSRLRAPPAPPSASAAPGATPAAAVATSAPTPSTHHDPANTISIQSLPMATDVLKHKLQRSRAATKTLPDMGRGTADQEAEVAELEARIARQRAVLEGLRSKGLDFAAARGQAGDKMEE